MPTTSIDLGKHFTEFITSLKEAGRYRSTSEAARANAHMQKSLLKRKLNSMCGRKYT